MCTTVPVLAIILTLAQFTTNIIITNYTFANNHGFKSAAILLDLVVDDQDLNGRVR